MPKDGDYEFIDGKKTGNVWSSKYEDWVYPDLEERKELHKDQAAKNVQVCYTCDKWIPSTRRCSECGCFMDLKNILLKLVDGTKNPCPLNKW